MHSADQDFGSTSQKNESASANLTRESWGVPALIPLDLSAARGFFCSKTNDGSKDLGPMNCS